MSFLIFISVWTSKTKIFSIIYEKDKKFLLPLVNFFKLWNVIVIDFLYTRYKSLCPSTWPSYSCTHKEGVDQLCKYLDYKEGEYRLGRTKIFIRFPRTLFATEDAFQVWKSSWQIFKSFGEFRKSSPQLCFLLIFCLTQNVWCAVFTELQCYTDMC